MKTTYNPPSLVTALLSVLVCVVLGCPGMAAGNPVRWSVPCDSVSTEMSDTLPELTVTRRLAERNGLTDSFVVDKALRANTHEAADIIGKLPGFHYNPLDKALTYLGSGNVIVLVDSMAKDESYIKRMNPSRIVRVSVTNFPGGKYADYDAVVNLVTARDYDGNDMVALSEATMSTGEEMGGGIPCQA